jgi:microcystin-dependent protein
MEAYVGSISLFAGNFAPTNFGLCQGQIMAISTNTALFSILGTYYGGNGSSTFGLPDLRGRAMIGTGQGPGLSLYDIGESLGTENVTLLYSNIPIHNHTMNAYDAQGTASTISGNIFAEGPKTGSGPTSRQDKYYNTSAPNVTLNPLAISTNIGGGSNPFNIIQPFLTLTPIVCLYGMYPSRN